MTKHLISRGLIAIALLALVVQPASSQGAQESVGAESVRPGDLVRLRVLRDSSLSGDYAVNQYGSVVLPILGAYDVTRETDRTLRDKVIRALLEVRFGPDIEVVVLPRVRVAGEVNAPGVYNLDPTFTVADAIAMAQGRTSLARVGDATLRRGGEVLSGDLRTDAQLSETRIRSGDEITVPRRSWLDQNAGTAVGAAMGLAGIIVTLIVR